MKAFGYAVYACGYVHGSWSDVGINLLRIAGLKVRNLFGSDMYRISRLVLVHIIESDVKSGDGRGNLHGFMAYPCGSAGRDIELKGY